MTEKRKEYLKQKRCRKSRMKEVIADKHHSANETPVKRRGRPRKLGMTYFLYRIIILKRSG